MRLFVAVRPPDTALAHADDALAAVRSTHPDLRWVPRERWHLTLAFYGEVRDDAVDGVVAMLGRRLADPPGRAGRVAALSLSLHGAGQFTRRALWLGVAGEVDDLRRVARSVTFDRRPYRPHLTIARLRGGVDASAAVEALTGYAGPAWVADRVHLVRSRLGPSPSYEDMATWTLEHRT